MRHYYPEGSRIAVSIEAIGVVEIAVDLDLIAYRNWGMNPSTEIWLRRNTLHSPIDDHCIHGTVLVGKCFGLRMPKD